MLSGKVDINKHVATQCSQNLCTGMVPRGVVIWERGRCQFRVLHAHLPNLDVQLIARVCTSCLELEDSLCQLDASGSLPTRLIPEELETPFHDDVDCKSQRVHRLQEQLDEKGKGELKF